jgi:hypothetical protein
MDICRTEGYDAAHGQVHVLWVDGNEDGREPTILNDLKRHGAQVDYVRSAEEAMDWLEENALTFRHSGVRPIGHTCPRHDLVIVSDTRLAEGSEAGNKLHDAVKAWCGAGPGIPFLIYYKREDSPEVVAVATATAGTTTPSVVAVRGSVRLPSPAGGKRESRARLDIMSATKLENVLDFVLRGRHGTEKGQGCLPAVLPFSSLCISVQRSICLRSVCAGLCFVRSRFSISATIITFDSRALAIKKDSGGRGSVARPLNWGPDIRME